MEMDKNWKANENLISGVYILSVDSRFYFCDHLDFSRKRQAGMRTSNQEWVIDKNVI